MGNQSLIQVADKIIEVLDRRRQNQSNYVTAITKTNSHKECTEQFQKLTEQIQSLSARMDSMFIELTSRQSRHRSPSGDARHRSPSHISKNNQKTCYYYNKFGLKVYEYNPPCVWLSLIANQQENETSHQLMRQLVVYQHWFISG